MSSFQAVNTTLSVPAPDPGRPGDETTPTTPRPNTTFFPEPQPSDDARSEDASARTPTRNSFGGLARQRPLPGSPFTPSHETADPTNRNGTGPLKRENSHRSTFSVDSQDIDMGRDEEGHEASDNDSAGSGGDRPSKKKKGQRFFCKDYPPCKLSFTRSEHLARHIRKHTGERPFTCHCTRRFSRLDNLRQHAQTVHAADEIPVDSPAASTARFSRQIRTDRVRLPGSRSRANTLGTQGGHSRGHSRNLSTSSIASTASNISVSQAQDVRRRPQPLAMANEGRGRLSLSTLDTYNPPLMGSPGPQIVDYHHDSATATTPTSATFSPATGSPSQYGSGYHSPASTASRPVSWGGAMTPGRRLSVPSGHHGFSGPSGQGQSPYLPPLSYSASSAFSSQSNLFASPGPSNYPEPRRDSNADADWRRRTWHPGTGTYSGPRPATSGLGYHQTPDAPRPSFTSQPAASQTTRLPGIESFSFDHAPPPPPLSRKRPSGDMQIDAPNTRPATYHAPGDPPPTYHHEKRASISGDSTLPKIHRLEIGSPNPQREAWPQYHGSPGHVSANRPTTAPHPSYMSYQQPTNVPQPMHAPAMETPRILHDPPATSINAKRRGWYNGPRPNLPSEPVRIAQRTSPEGSSGSEGVSTPSSASMTEYYPGIVHGNGHVEAHPPGVSVQEHKPGPSTSIMDRPHPVHNQHQQVHNRSISYSAYQPLRELARAPPFVEQNHRAHDMDRLQALVAVASEQQAVGNRS